MSKSLGNSPDALGLIEDYSADAVRAGMMLLSSGAGTDLLFDESKLQQGKAFSNKILNAYKLISGWEIDSNIKQPESSKVALEWYNSKFQEAYAEIEDHFSKYRLSDALMTTYKLIWDDFCSWLLEMIKPGFQKPIDKYTLEAVINIFENNLKVLHPFMPFLTEELWHQISDRDIDEALIVSKYPDVKSIDQTILKDFEIVAEVISGIRTVRKNKNISFKDTIEFSVLNNENVSSRFDSVIKKLGNISELNYVTEKVDAALSFRVRSNEYFIPMTGTIDVEAEIKKLNEELSYIQGFLKSVQKKLSNDRFVNNAPDTVIISERKKEADALAKIETINDSLASLS
jgi:valyl-tRNA synthetase